MSTSFIIQMIRVRRGFVVAPEPAETLNGTDSAPEADDFDECSDLCDFGYVLVRRESNPAGDTPTT